MRYDWLAIAGETLNGRYDLARFEDEVGGVGRYVSGNQTIDVVPVAAPESRDIAERWRFLQSVSHPNLLTVVDIGTADLAGVDVVYCVSERPDDTVASVLPERPLTPEETDQIVASVLPALTHLRQRGAAYTRLSATEITAVGDEVKLALDRVEPLGDRMGREWTRADIESVLDGKPVVGVAEKPAVPPPPPQPPPPPPPAVEPARAVPVAAPPPRSFERAPEPREERPAPPQVPVTLSTVRKAALIGTAVLVLIVLYQVFRSRAPEPTPAAADVTRSSPVAPVPSPEAQRPVAPPAAAAKPVGGWSVVVGAYGREQDAKRRVAALASRWPRGPIQVVRSKGRYLLVAATGLTSRAEADLVRREARSAGLSRSAYVTRL